MRTQIQSYKRSYSTEQIDQMSKHEWVIEHAEESSFELYMEEWKGQKLL